MTSSNPPPHSEKMQAWYARDSKYDPMSPEICSLLAKGVYGTEIASKLGISYSSLMKWLSGKRKEGNPEVLKATQEARQLIEQRSNKRREKKPKKEKRVRKPSKWGDDNRDILRKLLKAGHSPTEIAEVFNTRTQNIWNVIRYTKDQQLTDTWEENKRMRAAKVKRESRPPRGETNYDKFVKAFGMSPTEKTLQNRKWMKKNGYKLNRWSNKTGKIGRPSR